MKIAIVTPHIFMWDKILKDSIFAPGQLAIDLSNELVKKGHEVTLFTTGKVNTKANIDFVDTKSIITELKKHNLNPTNLIKNDLVTFEKLFKIIEYEILANVFSKADKFDVIHIFITNGPEGPIFSKTIKNTPILFTLHDPFKLNFPNPESYSLLKGISFNAISNNQKFKVPQLNVIKTIYNGIKISRFKFIKTPSDYFAYYGRIIKPKGVHHAVNVCKELKIKLKIAGLHYEGHGGDHYWSQQIYPYIDNKLITYEGFLKKQIEKNKLLGHAKALLFPIEWQEPFGLVLIESNACGTPVIAYKNGSVPEIVKNGINGYIVNNEKEMLQAMKKIHKIDRIKCREYVKKNFNIQKMVSGYENCYKELI